LKICWDNLEKLKYLPETGHWRDYTNRQSYIYVDSCKKCNESFLALLSSLKKQYCTISCSMKGNKRGKVFLFGRDNPNWKSGLFGKDNPNWKGGVKTLPIYDVYSHYFEYEEIRKNKDDGSLEVKCIYCSEWFIPTIMYIYSRIKRPDLRFYCSKKCKIDCMKYRNNIISKYKKNKYSPNHSKETIEKIKEAKRKNPKKHTELTKIRIRKMMKIRWESPSYRKKKSDAYANNPISEYYRKNIPRYEIHADRISYAEKVRRSPEDRNVLEVKCAYCGKWHVPLLLSVYARSQSLNGVVGGENRLYCSDECKQECPIYNQKKYPKGFKKATSREVQPELRQMVLERDKWECQKCGSTKSLHCHHIEGIRWEPLESADIDQCITYCKICHKEVHKKEGCTPHDMKCPEPTKTQPILVSP